MLRVLIHSFAVISIFAPPPQTPAELRIASIQVKGNQRYTAEEVTRLSGLEIGRTAKPDDLAAAANRMAATGLFEAVRYSYTTGRAMSVVFEISEPARTVPVILDNFVWLSDEELFEGIRDADAAALHRQWTLKAGDVYDEDYEARYLREEILPLKTSSGGRGSLAKRVDPATQTVDVKIVFT
jgi:outer membrane protein assembly factor BamA